MGNFSLLPVYPLFLLISPHWWAGTPLGSDPNCIARSGSAALLHCLGPIDEQSAKVQRTVGWWRLLHLDVLNNEQNRGWLFKRRLKIKSRNKLVLEILLLTLLTSYLRHDWLCGREQHLNLFVTCFFLSLHLFESGWRLMLIHGSDLHFYPNQRLLSPFLGL